MARDYARFARRFHLPHRQGTFEGESLIETDAQLRRLFDDMCDYYEVLGVRDLKRVTIAAEFASPTEMHSTFISRHLLRDYRLSDEIVAMGQARLEDGLWRIVSGQYATKDPHLVRVLRRTALSSGKTDAPRDEA